MDVIGTINNLLLTQNNLLSLCCCGETEYQKYWEAVPCDAYSLPGENCFAFNPCTYNQRRYVSVVNSCYDDIYVCECQKIKITNWSDLTQTSLSGASLSLDSNFDSCTGTITNDSISVTFFHTSSNTQYNKTFAYTEYPIIESLASGINQYQISGVSPLAFNNLHFSVSGISNCFATGIFSINTSATTYLASQTGGLYVCYNDITSNFIEWNSNVTTFKNNLQSGIRSISGLEELEVYGDNDNLGGADKTYYLVFAGNQCGIAQSNLSVKNKLVTINSAGFAPFPQMSYGEYASSFGNEAFEYIRVPSGNVFCPYEDSSYQAPNGDEGYAIYNTGIQCCPQKGVTLGPPQLIRRNKLTYGNNFQNLETTVLIDDNSNQFVSKCYKLDPFFFIFGKEGRFDNNPTRINQTYVRSNCNYGVSGVCDYGLPDNCVPELFISSFGHTIPWGPFGSYYSGIEAYPHPAVGALTDGDISAGQNYMADNNFKGYEYAPSGRLLTAGSWTATTGIRIEFLFYKMVPYYVGSGSPSNPIDKVIGKINEASLSNGLVLSSGNTGTGITVLSFPTSGKSVYDFITAVNNVNTQEVSGISCPVFSFCGAASDTVLQNISCDKINNLSSELFNVWKVHSGSPGSNPVEDLYGYSAGSIWPAPKKYSDMLMNTPLSSTPDIFNSGISRGVSMPIPCRRTNNNNHFTSYDSVYRHNCKPYWTALQGKEYGILSISKNAIADIDPNITNIWMDVSSSGNINIVLASGGTIIHTTGVPLSIIGSGINQHRLASILEGMQFNYIDNPTGFYSPFVTSSGNTSLNFEVLLADNTWWNGTNPTDPGTGTLTPYNFGYREQITQQASGDILSDTYNLYAWIRNRCIASNTAVYRDNEFLACLPPDASFIDPPNRINCSGTEFYDRNWLVNYGCNSYNCKTEWFIKAKRCSCTTAPACDEDSGAAIEGPHPVNRENPDDCSKLSQPSFYMCESNLHPQCDIAFLIKVPFQFVCTSGVSNCAYGDCYQTPNTAPFFVAPCPTTGIIEPMKQVGYSVPNLGEVAGITNHCYMDNGYEGWCQYIDPLDLQKVERRDIPRTWPPKALIMERVNRPFCTTYVNALDLPSVCIYPKYDALTPIIPMVPYEYIIPEGFLNEGLPCMLANTVAESMYAYIRPMVKNFNISSISDCTGLCGKSDIDCNTRCCYCGFSCNTSDGCADQGPNKNCKKTEEISKNTDVDGPDACTWIAPEGTLLAPGVCNYGFGCGCTPGAGAPLPATYPPQYGCMDGSYTISEAISLTKKASYDNIAGYTLDQYLVCVPVYAGLGCCWDLQGQSVYQYEKTGCEGDCWHPGCGGYGGTRIACGATDGTCLTETINTYDCGLDFGVFVTEYNNESYTFGRYDCTDPCLSLFPDRGCVSLALFFSETDVVTSSNNTLNLCDFGAIAFNLESTERLNGTSSSGVTCGGTGVVSLGIKFGGGGADYCGGSCGSYTGDYIYQGNGRHEIISGVYTVTDLGCTSCNFDNITENKDYDYIVSFQTIWECGLPNDKTTISTELYS